jgi:Na+-driven multidrug efflux pump
MAQIGLPIALSELGLLASGFLNLHMISLLPQANTLEAAWAIKTRLEEFANVAPVCALAFGVTPFVARHWESSWKSKRVWAKHILSTAIAFSTLVPALLCAVAPLASAGLVDIFTAEAAVQEKTCIVLTLSTLAWPFFTVAQLFFSALAGAGKTFIPSLLTLICILPLRFCLAFILKDCPGLEGVALLTVSGVIAQAVLAAGMVIYFFAMMKERSPALNADAAGKVLKCGACLSEI